MPDLFPKFIVEGDNLIIAKVTFHKDLVIDKDQVKGGGWWKRDGDIFILHGSSFDFGSAKVEDIKAAVDARKVWSDQYEIHNITDQYSFQYITDAGEIIELK